MKERQFASALACLTAALLGSCSNEMPEQKAPEEQAGGITFRITLPSAGKVQYGGSRAAIHEEEEYTVKDLKVFQYKSYGSTDLVNDKLVATYDFSEEKGTLHPAGEGTVNPGVYTVTLPKDASLNYSEPYRFYFVANVATLTKQGISFDSYTAGTGADTDRYGRNLCNQGMVLKNDVTQSGSVPAEKLHEDWFVMSGMARVNGATGDGSDVIMIKPASVNDMNVQLSRIEARIDLYSNAPNLMITDAWIEDAYFGGFVMDTHTDSISAATFGKGTVTVNNKDRGGALGKAVKNLPMDATGALDPYAEYDDALRLKQTYSPNADADVTIGVRKALYMFERKNSARDYATIKVRYRLKDGSMGIATVPFRERLADGTAGDYVNVERNHLYKVVLGNGDEIKSGARVEGLIIDEPWNVVDLPAVVDGPSPFVFSWKEDGANLKYGYLNSEKSQGLVAYKGSDFDTPVSITTDPADFPKTVIAVAGTPTQQSSNINFSNVQGYRRINFYNYYIPDQNSAYGNVPASLNADLIVWPNSVSGSNPNFFKLAKVMNIPKKLNSFMTSDYSSLIDGTFDDGEIICFDFAKSDMMSYGIPPMSLNNNCLYYFRLAKGAYSDYASGTLKSSVFDDIGLAGKTNFFIYFESQELYDAACVQFDAYKSQFKSPAEMSVIENTFTREYRCYEDIELKQFWLDNDGTEEGWDPFGFTTTP